MTAVMGRLAMRQPTNSDVPTGGVINPKHRLTTMMAPKWMMWIPILVASGNRMGVSMMMAGVWSMNIPTMKRKKLRTNLLYHLHSPCFCF